MDTIFYVIYIKTVYNPEWQILELWRMPAHLLYHFTAEHNLYVGHRYNTQVDK